MDLINELIKFVIIITVSYLIFNKTLAENINVVNKLLTGIGYVVLATLMLFALKYRIEEPYKTIIVIAVSGAVLSILRKQKIESTLLVLTISYAISYILYPLTIVVASLILKPIFTLAEDSVIFNILAGILSFTIVFLLSKVKVNLNLLRKKGVGGTFLFISGIVFVLYSLFRESVSYKSMTLALDGFIISGFGIYCCLKRETTIEHNEINNEIVKKKLQNIVDEKERDNELLTKSHDYLEAVVHKDKNDLRVIQRAVEKLIMRSQQADILMDAKKVLEEINLSREQTDKDLTKQLTNGIELPLTGLRFIDAAFEIMLEDSVNLNIGFDLEINGDMSGIYKFIPQIELVTVIGDLSKNAFIAIKHLDKSDEYRNITVAMNMTDDIFELVFEDGGIPFEIDTLVNLGAKQVTTHKSEGGSGNGYKSIFEQIKKHSAGITVTEYEPIPFTHSKRIAIKFDGNYSYTVQSFRAGLIRKQNTNDNLAVVDL